MSFLIQDLLDYAQIKAGQFRKNIAEFNIRDAIEQVVCIQKDQAKAKNVDLNVIYKNIYDTNNQHESGSGEGEVFSPIMKSDVSRIQQVLLNLQSNALKFTS